MKLYHATSLENGEKIFLEGLKPTWGFVYLTNELKIARRFGGVVFEVDSDFLDEKKLGQYEELLCRLYKCDPFYHYADTIPAHCLRVVMPRERSKKPKKEKVLKPIL